MLLLQLVSLYAVHYIVLRVWVTHLLVMVQEFTLKQLLGHKLSDFILNLHLGGHPVFASLSNSGLTPLTDFLRVLRRVRAHMMDHWVLSETLSGLVNLGIQISTWALQLLLSLHCLIPTSSSLLLLEMSKVIRPLINWVVLRLVDFFFHA